MDLIDTHSHLYLPDFDEDREMVMENALANGVGRIVLPNIDLTSAARLHSMVADYPDCCIPLMGLHPSSVDANFRNNLQEVFSLLEKNKYYGVGEIGIDLYWEDKYKEQQTEAFRLQVDYALKKNLPVVIHARESFEEIFAVLDQFAGQGIKGIFHAFTGTVEQAERVIKLGFKIGIGGIVTFKNAGLDKVVAHIDLNHIVLETDSPYLAPVPKRGKRNESAYLLYIARRVGEIHNVGIETVAGITTNNALEVFRIS